MSPCDAPYVCPAEHAGWLSTPIRKLVTNPTRILRGLVRRRAVERGPVEIGHPAERDGARQQGEEEIAMHSVTRRGLVFGAVATPFAVI